MGCNRPITVPAKFLATAAGLLVLSQGSAEAAPSERCDTASLQALAPKDTTVAFAAREQGGCRVTGFVTTRDPGPNRVLFVLALPDAFNGRYVYLGVGGAAGQLPTIPGDLLSKGYVLAGSDGGTGAKSGADFSFQTDAAKRTDFAWRGVHVTAQATQHMTRAYYARPQLRRYISGCSGGGNMGRANAQRFGTEDFDGFLVGAVPWPATLNMVNFFRIARHLQNRPEGWISPELMKKVQAAILARYDGSDGAVDGIISDQRNIERFDTGILRQLGFTPAQVETFETISNGFKYPSKGLRGDGYHPGYPVTDVSGWSNFLLGRTPPPWPSTAELAPAALQERGAPFIHVMVDTKARAFEPGIDYTRVTDFSKIYDLATNGGRDLPQGDTMDHGLFARSGGKMIFYHGVNDQAASYLDTALAFEVLSKRYANADGWLRAYFVPGMQHCRGGEGPTDVSEQLLEALVAWVERDQRPDAVVANRFDRVRGLERSFQLCPEPQRARLGPGLDPKEARNWLCAAPAPALR